MNVWECEYPGCHAVAWGCGGAVGLRAIGWYFEVGPVILCPRHRPDPIQCTEESAKPCSLCAAEREARFHQSCIAAEAPRSSS